MAHPIDEPKYRELAIKTATSCIVALAQKGMVINEKSAKQLGLAIRTAYAVVAGASEETPEERIAKALEEIRANPTAVSGEQ